MKHHRAETSICGNVVGDARCHPSATGVVANFTVVTTTPWGRGSAHTENYRCVAFGAIGEQVQATIEQGECVSVTGFMKTSKWSDGSGRVNHQLIVKTFSRHATPERLKPTSPPATQKQSTVHRTTAPQPLQKQPETTARPMMDKSKRRSYGRHARKQKTAETDFRAVADEPEFNDELPPL